VQSNDFVSHLDFLALQTLLRQARAACDFLHMIGAPFHASLKSGKVQISDLNDAINGEITSLPKLLPSEALLERLRTDQRLVTLDPYVL
jgi:hypothetical protein